MDDICPQTSWSEETEPTTTWTFSGCLASIITAGQAVLSVLMDDPSAVMDDTVATMDNI